MWSGKGQPWEKCKATDSLCLKMLSFFLIFYLLIIYNLFTVDGCDMEHFKSNEEQRGQCHGKSTLRCRHFKDKDSII